MVPLACGTIATPLTIEVGVNRFSIAKSQEYPDIWLSSLEFSQNLNDTIQTIFQ